MFGLFIKKRPEEIKKVYNKFHMLIGFHIERMGSLKLFLMESK